MTVVERYLTLGLRLGRHVDGLVDAYYGPPELAAAVEAEEPRAPAALAADADELLAELPDAGLDQTRAGWLGDQLRGSPHLRGRPRRREDSPTSTRSSRATASGPSACLSPRSPRRTAGSTSCCPLASSLHERYETWRTANAVPAERIVETMTAILALLRERTQALVPLPADEEFALELVAGSRGLPSTTTSGDIAAGSSSTSTSRSPAPRSSTSPPTRAIRAITPSTRGRSSSSLERRGHLEESLQLVPTPQALLSEGIAELGGELLIDERARRRVRAHPRRPRASRTTRPRRRRSEPRESRSATCGRNAALAIHEDGLSVEEAQAYIERWALAPPKRAAHTIAFITDPTWRAYVVTYTEGRRLARAYVDGDLGRFRSC